MFAVLVDVPSTSLLNVVADCAIELGLNQELIAVVTAKLALKPVEVCPG